MIISRKAGKAVMAAVAAAKGFQVSYPFWSSWKDPVLGKGLETVVDVSLVAVDSEGAVAMRWFAQDPLIVLKAAVRRDPGALVRIVAECDAGNLGGAEVHRDFTMDQLSELGGAMTDVVSALAHAAISEAYSAHPSATRFMEEAAAHFGWNPVRLKETLAMVDGHGRPKDDEARPIGEPEEAKQLELMAA